MRLAIPTDDGHTICSHFGRTRGFQIVETGSGKIIRQEYRMNDFTGHASGRSQHDHGHLGSHAHHDHEHTAHTHSGILDALEDCQVVIANGMGQRLWNDLHANNYEVFITRETDISRAVELYLEGTLDSDGEKCCDH